DIVVDHYFNGSLEGEQIKVKSEIKRQLYNYLSKLTGKKLLWGTLTGIRPVTIVTKLFEENNLTDKEVYEELKNEYYVSDEKAFELIKIAKKEIELLNKSQIKSYKDSYSIYIGVPFCKSTCLYCSFTSFNIEKFGKYVDAYLNKLETEFKARASSIEKSEGGKLKPLTIYIGGGTPTSLDHTAFERLLSIIDRYVDKEVCVEYTVEAGRPDTIDEDKLKLMKKYGVTRISINPQSFNQKTLDLIGRKHTVKDVVKTFKLARSLAFDNINMDIILGLPNEHLFDVLKTLNGIRRLKPDSFTVHSLALKRAARLNYELDAWTENYYLAGVGDRARNARPYDSDVAYAARLYESLATGEKEGKREIDKMFYWSERLASFLKLEPYYLYRQKNMAGNLENIGYAKVGKECIYNIMMMSERHSVYGFGTATTKEVFYENGGKRIESEEGYKSVIDYCER
ncbi:MAG: coproporphyrinogen dehydrogenase HemZ, partial [Lachnospiraceae bacterium]|nr:coproporphyrinogen dehydrogenase HemZ [Lachnospiraceae bacterium]